ncbi:MAG: AgmX/PglI C-terminal domain-containing protein [Kofleriaceae bacterium]
MARTAIKPAKHKPHLAPHARPSLVAGAPLTPERVISVIQTSYMRGIRQCYRNRLKKDPSAQGRVTVVFTIDESGRTTHREAKGFAGEVDSCISSKMRRWRFPVPVNVEGQPTELSFMTTLHLMPE